MNTCSCGGKKRACARHHVAATQHDTWPLPVKLKGGTSGSRGFGGACAFFLLSSWIYISFNMPVSISCAINDKYKLSVHC